MKIIIITLISISAIACWIFWPRKKPTHPEEPQNNMICMLTVDSEGNEMRILRTVKPGEKIKTISDGYIAKLKQERGQEQEQKKE
ncbi:MAG: hypothetical protein GYB20_02125 [Oceanospirillales bacterium]|nr:hypothetical protein [Oceanospirillales bacterium]